MKRLPPLNALRVFAAAAQQGSFTKAGEALHVTQGAISRQVKLLEDCLGRPLFARVHNGLKLTEAGQALSETLNIAFASIEDRVERITRDQCRLQLAINIPPTFATRWLAPRLSTFCRLYPYVDLKITTNWVQSPRESQAYDCLVIFEQGPWPKADCVQLMLERHVMVSSPSMWNRSLPPVIQNHLLLHILNGADRLPIWERWIERFGPCGVDPKPGLDFSTLDQAINATLSGTGIAIVDEAMIMPELEAGTLRKLTEVYMDGPNGYWFVNAALDDEHRAIARLCREWMQTQASEGTLARESTAG